MTRVKLTRGKYALIDDADAERVIKTRWAARVKPNSTTRTDRFIPIHMVSKPKIHQESLPEFLIGKVAGKIIGFRDGNSLNCQRANLYHATRSQHHGNRHKAAHCTSQYKGVSWNKQSKRWIARIAFNGINYQLGGFREEIDAAKAYNRRASELFGDLARLNVIPDT
jgi:hypothetical protein